jgi:KaiC domain protein
MIERVSTGIPEFDRMLSGGIPRGFLVAVVGEPGTGKTIFCQHFISAGLRIGEPGIYVTTEESRESIIKQADMLGLGFSRGIQTGRLIIIDALMGDRGDPWSLREMDIDELLSKIIEAKKTLGYGHARLVIDSMSAFWLDKPAMARKYSYRVKRMLSRWDLTILATSQYAVTTSLGFGFGIEHIADGIIRFKKYYIGNELQRFIVIEKMRQTPHDKRVYRIDIVDGKGIVVLGPAKYTAGELHLPLSVIRRMIEAEMRKEAEMG